MSHSQAIQKDYVHVKHSVTCMLSSAKMVRSQVKEGCFLRLQKAISKVKCACLSQVVPVTTQKVGSPGKPY